MDKNIYEIENKFLLNTFSIEYKGKVAMLMFILGGLRRLINVDDLDIDIESCSLELSNIEKQVTEKEKSNSITIDFYKSSADKIEELINKMNEDYSPSNIIDLYFKNIYQLLGDGKTDLDEIKVVAKRMVEYFEYYCIDDEEEYNKICEKYGDINSKTLLELIALSYKQNMGNKK